MNEGGHFSLSVRADEGDALVTVVDDGVRIPNELLQRALGLALSKRFSERAYTERIPLADAHRHAGMPPVTYRASPRRRILVVDGDVEAARALEVLLRQLGHDVQLAHDNHAALEAARINRPQIILLELGGTDGHRLVERVRRDPRLAKVRFVAVTASSDRDAGARSRAAGFEEHMVKPLELDTLRRLLERL